MKAKGNLHETGKMDKKLLLFQLRDNTGNLVT